MRTVTTISSVIRHQKRDARGEQFRSSRAPLFGIHRGLKSRFGSSAPIRCNDVPASTHREAATGKPGHGLVEMVERIR